MGPVGSVGSVDAGEHAMSDDYQLDGLATPAILEQLHELLALVRDEHPDLAAEDLMMFETAVIEIAGNVVEHGMPPGQVPYRFTLAVSDDRVAGVLSHAGDRLDGALGRDMPGEDAEDGRGLPLAELALDDLTYAHDDGVSSWHMSRTRAGVA